MRWIAQIVAAAGLLTAATLAAHSDDATHGTPPGSTSAPTVGAATPAPPADDSKPVDVTELMKPGPLGEEALGDPKAKVTVVEYASMTCPHCAHFSQTTFDTFKKKYVDTGKVYYVFREFPLDSLSEAAFVLARCAPGPVDQFFPIVELLFSQQDTWAFVDNPAPALQKLLADKGIDEAKFKSCLNDQRLIQGVIDVAKRGTDVFGIDGTPTFFINGQRHVGDMEMDELDKILQPLL